MNDATRQIVAGFSRRSLARIAYIAAFVGIDTLTDLFSQYPRLRWLGIAGLVVIFFDAVICARRRWRAVKGEMREDDDTDPSC